MSYTVAGPYCDTIDGKTYVTWTVTEENIDDGEHFVLTGVPTFCTITQYDALLNEGSPAESISPEIWLDDEFDPTMTIAVAVNATPAQRICNRGRVAVTALAGKLFCRSMPSSGTVNGVTTWITVQGGHC